MVIVMHEEIAYPIALVVINRARSEDEPSVFFHVYTNRYDIKSQNLIFKESQLFFCGFLQLSFLFLYIKKK
jgi:hypothetical protein